MSLINSTMPNPAAIRIFLVEDSPDVRDLLIENLQEIPGINYAGFSETENDALSRLNQDNYDVLILDIQLKQGNGMSLLQSLARASVQQCLSPGGRKTGRRILFRQILGIPAIASIPGKSRGQRATAMSGRSILLIDNK
jgi:CheY-like chemotaxis protein